MDIRRKPLARVGRRRRLRLSGLTVAWRGTPSLDDWVAYIVSTKSKKLILADHASERKVRNLMSRLQTMPKSSQKPNTSNSRASDSPRKGDDGSSPRFGFRFVTRSMLRPGRELVHIGNPGRGL